MRNRPETVPTCFGLPAFPVFHWYDHFKRFESMLADDSRFVTDFLGDRVPAVYPPFTHVPRGFVRDVGSRVSSPGGARTWPPVDAIVPTGQSPVRFGRCVLSEWGTPEPSWNHDQHRRRPANSLLKRDSADIAELFPRRPAILSRRQAMPDQTQPAGTTEMDGTDGMAGMIQSEDMNV